MDRQKFKNKLTGMNYTKGQEKLLIIEPFYGGSHKKLIDIICTSKYVL